MQHLGSWRRSIGNQNEKNIFFFLEPQTRDNPCLLLMQVPLGLCNPSAAVARGLEMLALPSRGRLARVGCERNASGGVSVNSHKPCRRAALRKQTLASSLLSAPMGPGSNICPQAKETSLSGSRQPFSFHPERAHLYGSTGGKWERKGGSSGPRVVPCCAGFPQKRMAVRFCRNLVWPVWHPAQAASSYH